MSNCPCDEPLDPAVEIARALNAIAAGHRALPRQVRSFPSVREALLAGLRSPGKDALAEWRARNSQDLGLMLLEMWAYVSDVLSFYDERIANETYIRTAQRSTSLRRLVDLLGYIPAPGIAGSVVLAALAEGRKTVELPAGTAFRSDAFEDQPPQVFELTQPTAIHPFKNEWTIGPQQRGTLPHPGPTHIARLERAQLAGDVGFDEEPGKFVVFETLEFGLAVDRLALITVVTRDPQAARVKSIRSFAAKDTRTYVEVEFDPAPTLSVSGGPSVPGNVKVQVPTVTAVVTKNVLEENPAPVTFDAAYLDAVYRQLSEGDFVLITVAGGDPRVAKVKQIEEAGLIVRSEVPGAEESDPPLVPAVTTLVTRVEFDSNVIANDEINNQRNAITFHFAFVNGGRITTVGETDLGAATLTQSPLPVDGIVERPPEVDPPSGLSPGRLEQDFLITDPDGTGAAVNGVMTFGTTGRSQFLVNEDSDDLPEMLKTPLTVFGNVVTATRGETVFNEVLGSGDARVIAQEFTLKKKPLTYLPAPNELGRESTLRVFVDQVRWKEVRTFFNCGPQDRVYIARHDEEQNTRVIFGNGVRGSRLPSGVNNVVASYRFGAGAAAPPAGAIQQIARPVLGLRSVRSPIAALPGKDPDPPELLRTLAPVSARLFRRAVSPHDFQALAALQRGVVRAEADFLWIPEEQRAGVTITYIGAPSESELHEQISPFGEEGLRIRLKRATRIEGVTLSFGIAAHPDFELTALERAIRDALLDPDDGPLALENTPIGSQLLVSPLFETVHSVPGVVAVRSVTLEGPGFSFDLEDHRMLCVRTGLYVDFTLPDAVLINFVEPVGAVSASREGGC